MMRTRLRDVLAVITLLLGATAAAFLWPHEHWWALAAVLLAMLCAAGVYRARRPALPLRSPLRLAPPAEPTPLRLPIQLHDTRH